MNKFIYIIFLLLLICTSGMAVFFYREVLTLKANPDIIIKEEAIDLVARLGRLIALPEGETPTVATVNDLTQLSGHPFFEKAKIGDRLILYHSAKKAYLYDPSANKILEVASINFDAGNSIDTDMQNIPVGASDESSP